MNNNDNNFNINNPFLAMGNNENNDIDMNAPVNYNNTNNSFPTNNNDFNSNSFNQNNSQINENINIDAELQINQYSNPPQSPSTEQLDSILGVGSSANSSNNNVVPTEVVEQNQTNEINNEISSIPTNNPIDSIPTNNVPFDSIPTDDMNSNEINEQKLDSILGLNGTAPNNVDNEQNVSNDNNQNNNNLNNQNKTNNSLGLILIVLNILSFCTLFLDITIALVGVCISIICFIVSIINIKKKVKYTKISAFLSLLVVATFVFLFATSAKKLMTLYQI